MESTENGTETGKSEDANLTLLALLRSIQNVENEAKSSNIELQNEQELRKLEIDRKRKVWLQRRGDFKKFRESLPIFQYKDDLLRAIEKNQVVVVVGETGSGKTTQITQYLYDAGFAKEKKIACTQPRRIAAKTVARRVAMEFGTAVGDLVGYKVRFDNQIAPDTVIVYLTDGLLVRELCSEPNANQYSVIMLDEAHERSIHTDVAMGLLKEVIRKRRDLKILVTSATLDAGKFSEYFNDAPVFKIPGRVYPVDIIYSPMSRDPDYLTHAINAVEKIHKTEPPGDILVFLTGQEEIEYAVEILAEHKDLLPLPLYSALPSEFQNAVFEPAPNGERKVILATNLAETSITIDGIVYVVDPGQVKQREYIPRTGIDNLVIKHISKAQAIQRAGRAGRTRPGKVFRLYTESTFNSMVPLPIPEIQRVNVEAVILQLASMGVTDILRFNFMDSPPTEAVTAGMDHLMDLLAFEIFGVRLELTQIGREMSGFPLEPMLSKVLIKSEQLGCSEEMLTIVALLSTTNQNIFYRPKKKRLLADEKIATFLKPQGDHITMLNVYKQWVENFKERSWCKNNFVQSRTLEEAEEIKGQLACLLTERNFKIVSCKEDYSKVQQAICSGFFRKVAKRNDRGHGYMTYSSSMSTRENVFIHPSSAVFKENPKWVIYHEVVKTKQAYMRQVIQIQPDWLWEQSPTFYKKLMRQFSGLVDMEKR